MNSGDTETGLALVVLISGRGSNLQALIDAQQSGDMQAHVRAVISNSPDAQGLERAHKAGIETKVLDQREFTSRDMYDEALMQVIDSFRPGLVVLAGFMRILTKAFVNHYHGRLINIHPSLLPAYRGLHTHRRVLEAGDKEHGASVHFVTEELDAGAVLLQAKVPVLTNDKESALAARVLEQEHRIYPLAVNWIAKGRVKLQHDKIRLDGNFLSAPVIIDTETTNQEKQC